MNSAVIVKLEYRFPGTEEFTPISYTGFSASLAEKTESTFAGIEHKIILAFTIPKCEAEKDRLVLLLSSRRAIYQATDANGSVYTIGSATQGARFFYNRTVDGHPGGLNGYDALITYQSKGFPLIS
jgi:hypothetical protein